MVEVLASLIKLKGKSCCVITGKKTNLLFLVY